MPESAHAARLKAVEDWQSKWEPRIEAVEDFKVWLIGIAAGVGFVVGLVTLGIIKVAVNV